MNALPKWFGIPSAVEDYIRDVRDMPFLAAAEGGETIAFLALKEHNEYTAEVWVMGVAPEYHRRGIGGTLIQESAKMCREYGRTFLTVKTYYDGGEYEPYARTLAFYRAVGFLPLQMLERHWDENNPCLMLAKWL